MAKVIKTARGKTLDMAGIMAKQERTRAVSNVKSVNARGDEIDSAGKIVKPVNQVVAESYANQVGSKSAQASRSSANPNAPLSPKQKRELETQREKAKETPLLDKLVETPKQTSVVEQEPAPEPIELLEDDFIEDEDEALDIEAIKKACLDAQVQKDAEAKKKGK